MLRLPTTLHRQHCQEHSQLCPLTSRSPPVSPALGSAWMATAQASSEDGLEKNRCQIRYQTWMRETYVKQRKIKIRLLKSSSLNMCVLFALGFLSVPCLDCLQVFRPASHSSLGSRVQYKNCALFQSAPLPGTFSVFLGYSAAISLLLCLFVLIFMRISAEPQRGPPLHVYKPHSPRVSCLMNSSITTRIFRTRRLIKWGGLFRVTLNLHEILWSGVCIFVKPDSPEHRYCLLPILFTCTRLIFANWFGRRSNKFRSGLRVPQATRPPGDSEICQ